MFRHCLILIVLSITVFRSCLAFAGDEVSFLTWNLWGIPWFTPAASERIAAGVDIIQQRSPDVICLQEVWGRGDIGMVREKLKAAGYSEVRHYPSWPYGSGLIIATRTPIRNSGFDPYYLRGKFYKPWHGDWYGGKGVAWVEVEIGGRRLRFLNTHLHSSEGNPTGEYLPTKLAQTGELITILKRHQKTGAAVVLCGDLNMRLQELPMRYLSGNTSVEVRTAGKHGAQSLDWILLQNGKSTQLQFRHYQRVRAPDFHEKLRVSDHPFIFATVRLSDSPTMEPSRSESATQRDESAQNQVLHILQEACHDSVKNMRWLLILDGTLLFALFPGVLREGKARWLRRALLVALALGIVWTIHFRYYEKGLKAAIVRHEELR